MLSPQRPAGGCRAALAATARAGGRPLCGSSEVGFSECPRGERRLRGTCSALSPVLYDPPAAASETPIRIKTTFRRCISDFIRCDKRFLPCAFLPAAGPSGASAAQGCVRARALAFRRAGGAGDVRQPRSPPAPHPLLLRSIRNRLAASPALQAVCSGFVPGTHILALIQISAQHRAHTLMVGKSSVIFVFPEELG